jgi:hypothetical protein
MHSAQNLPFIFLFELEHHMKSTAFWDHRPDYGGSKAVCTSETSVYLYETTRVSVLDGCHLHICHVRT